jgi:hypothetical protein
MGAVGRAPSHFERRMSSGLTRSTLPHAPKKFRPVDRIMKRSCTFRRHSIQGIDVSLFCRVQALRLPQESRGVKPSTNPDARGISSAV